MNFLGFMISACLVIIITAGVSVIPILIIIANKKTPQPTPAQNIIQTPVTPKAPVKKYPDNVQEQFADYLRVMETLKYDSTVEKTRELVKFLINEERFPNVALTWFEEQVRNGQIADNMPDPSKCYYETQNRLLYLTEDEMREACEEAGEELTEDEAVEFLRQKEIAAQEEFDLLTYDESHRRLDGSYERNTAEDEEYYQEQKAMGFPFNY